MVRRSIASAQPKVAHTKGAIHAQRVVIPGPQRRGRINQVHIMIMLLSVSLFSVIFFLISDIARATRSTSIAQNRIEDNFNNASMRLVNLPLKLPDVIDGDSGVSADNSSIQSQIDKAVANMTNSDGTPSKIRRASVQAPHMQWKKLEVERGDTVSKIFTRLKLNPRELHQVMGLGQVTKTLNMISPGEELKFLTIDGNLQELIYQIDEINALHIRREKDRFVASKINTNLDKRIAYASATIDQSLYIAAQEAGIPGSLTMELATIFDWDVNFVLDVRAGDRFSVVFEEYYLDGKKISNGEILAAEFINNGKVYRAVRYTDAYGDSNYYTPEGQSMRRAFLRTPVDFTRISSKFGKRMHPKLNRMRDHKGVDFAAPMGTPIKASGEGRVQFLGKKGGYGNVIILQHGGKYTTLYAHMKSFKRHLHKGDKVKQGQIIGYVGMTGLATGPHLHYEFRINGANRDPLTVKLPGASPITSASRLDFKLNTQGYLTLLDTLSKTRLAMR